MIPLWHNYFGKRTAWSLIYFLNYAYFEIWPSAMFFVHPLSCNIHRLNRNDRQYMYLGVNKYKTSKPRYHRSHPNQELTINLRNSSAKYFLNSFKWRYFSPHLIYLHEFGTSFLAIKVDWNLSSWGVWSYRWLSSVRFKYKPSYKPCDLL